VSKPGERKNTFEAESPVTMVAVLTSAVYVAPLLHERVMAPLPLTTFSDVVKRIFVVGPTFEPEGEALLIVGATPSVVTVKDQDVKELKVLPARSLRDPSPSATVYLWEVLRAAEGVMESICRVKEVVMLIAASALAVVPPLATSSPRSVTVTVPVPA
jgi:hypothetical protein